MKYAPKYVAAFPKEALGQFETENIMQAALGVEKNGDIQVCFGDTTIRDEAPEYLSESAYPNGGELMYGKHALWLSMFTRHLPDTKVIELTEEED